MQKKTLIPSGNPMTKIVMIVIYVAALVFLGLAYLPDPKIIGITSEPSTIMFYGLSGLLAGLSFVVAVISTFAFAIGRWRASRGQAGLRSFRTDSLTPLCPRSLGLTGRRGIGVGNRRRCDPSALERGV